MSDEYLGRRRASAGESPDQLALLPIKQQPFNAEAPLGALLDYQTPTPLFYVRSNFPLPEVDQDRRLIVDGLVEQSLALTLDDLKALPAREIDVTLECAGNDRKGYSPPAEGEQWNSGAISSGRWRGVELRAVLEQAGLRDSVAEILFEGADQGQPHGEPIMIHFARSLPLEKALHPDTLLAYELNGEPLPEAHGGPLRLLVSGWYGMASVKWLARIGAIGEPFAGYYQAQRYILDRPGHDDKEPLREMRVKSLIITLPDHAPAGYQTIAGVAWSGSGGISNVEVSIDDGDWQPARLIDPQTPYAWRRWEIDWQATPGHHVIRARSSDAAGNTQPETAEWNRLGYANNAIQELEVVVA